MKEAVFASDPANAARLAVVLVLVVVIEEIADEASIFAESRAALFTICLHLLARVTLGADQLHELLSVECVRLGVIVTEATRVDLPTARALEETKEFFWKINLFLEQCAN